MLIKKIILKSILWLIIFFLLGAIAYGGFFLFKLNSFSNKISIEKKPETIFDTLKLLAKSAKNNPANLKKTEDDKINILLLGVAGKGKPGQNLTDTIMLASLNLKTNQVALLSLPRDLYAGAPDSGFKTKINSIYQAGLNNGKNESEAIDPLLKTVESITSLNINYYATLNFDGFKKIIDAIGGINISNERDIYDARYPGANYSYETFELKKGFQHLNGDLALKYARERHDDPDGDFGRARRQQQIIQAAKNKVFSGNALFNIFTLNNLFNALGDNLKTNISSQELETFYELSRELDTNNIINVTIDAWNKDSLLKVSHIFYGETRAFILIPRAGNYSEIQDLARNIFDLNNLKRRREEIIKEDASVALINKSGDNNIANKIKKLLSENLVYKNVLVVNDTVKDLENATTVCDSTSGIKPFTLDELAAKLPARVSYSLPDKYKKITEKNSPDITVVIGKDLIEKYSMEEDSIEDYKKAQDEQDYFNN